MKPRRWYSSPEHNPDPAASPAHPFPAPIYWVFTARTQLEQGAIIKSAPPAPTPSPRRGTTTPVAAPLPPLIDAA